MIVGSCSNLHGMLRRFDISLKIMVEPSNPYPDYERPSQSASHDPQRIS